jgi:hypothetical protein
VVVVMEWPLALDVLVCGGIMLVGFALGMRVEEHFLEVRERRLARARRGLDGW